MRYEIRPDKGDQTHHIHVYQDKNESDENILLAFGLAALELKTLSLPLFASDLAKEMGYGKDEQNAAFILGVRAGNEQASKELENRIETVKRYIETGWRGIDNAEVCRLCMDYVDGIPVKLFMNKEQSPDYFLMNTWSYCGGDQQQLEALCKKAQEFLHSGILR